MDFFWQLLWFFFMASALQPVIQQHVLEAARRRRLASFERKRNSRVIAMVHRQETMRFLGFPLVRYIDINDSEEILRAIRLTDRDVPIDIVLHTPGGLVLAALQIARALREHPGKVTAYVPHYAMSGGTLICLAANEIVLSSHAVMGPIDPQLGESPAASLIKVSNKNRSSGFQTRPWSWRMWDVKRSSRSARPLLSCWTADYPKKKRRNSHRSCR